MEARTGSHNRKDRANDELRRTKIVATLGPATREPDKLLELIEAGVDVIRLNFSHGTTEEHAENITRIRTAAEQVGRQVGILGDLPGPKLRLGDVEEGVVRLGGGNEVELTTIECMGTAERLSISWDDLPGSVDVGDAIYLADGRIRLRALEVGDTGVRCEIEMGGNVSSHQGVNLPESAGSLPAAGAEDLALVDFAAENDVDLLAVSFVRTAEDLVPVRNRLREQGSKIPLIAKIEKPQAAENAVELVRAATSGIMVARGDLGIELPIETVPVVQKQLIREAGRQAKPAITATQMLASMVSSDRPTRAEVTDVANAIYDGADAVMLSEETAIGQHAPAAVRVMHQVAIETERDLPYDYWLYNRVENKGEVAESVAQAAVITADRLGAAAIVVPTRSGRTARLISALRPRIMILAVSPEPSTVRRLNLLWGVHAHYHAEWANISPMLTECGEIARDSGLANSGELIVITAGLPEQDLGTNLLEVHRVP